MQYDMVFQGGGARGMAFVGAYEEFVNQGHTHGRLLGTSAGAITAALIAAGYSPAEMLEALCEREDDQSVFAAFLGEPPPFADSEIYDGAIRTLLRNIDFTFLPEALERPIDDRIAMAMAKNPLSRRLVALVERGGWYSADHFISWFERRLDSGTWANEPRRFSGMTLAEFYDGTQVDLSVVASDTTGTRMLVLNHTTAPDCPLVWAVRMSMSIPLVWDEVIWQAGWGEYRGQNITGHAIVDGGMLSNFPLELFISDEPYVTAVMGPKREAPVLGLLLDDSLPVPQLDEVLGGIVNINTPPMELRVVQRIVRLAETAMTGHDKMVLDAFNHLVVRLPTQGYGLVEFDMSDARREALVAAGRRALSSYFGVLGAAPDVSFGADSAIARETADRIALSMLKD